MSWILDGVAVLTALIFLILGAKRGFIRSAIRLIGMIAALVAAALISPPASQWIFEAWLQEPITKAITSHAGQAAVEAARTVQEQITVVMESLPSAVQSAFEVSGIGMPQTGAPIDSEALTTLVVDAILRPLALSMLQAILFLVLFAAAVIVAGLLARVVDKAFNTLPIIRQVNGFLGGLIGLLEGVGAVYVLSLVLRLYMTMTGGESVVTTAHLDATYIVQYFVNFRLTP